MASLDASSLESISGLMPYNIKLMQLVIIYRPCLDPLRYYCVLINSKDIKTG